MRWLSGGILMLMAAMQIGCGAVQKPEWNKPWGKGALAGAAICCPAGAGVGMWIQTERRGSSTFINEGTGEVTVVQDDKDLWKGALIGCAIGAPICGVIGHVFFDEPEVVEPLPPPPSPAGIAGGTAGEGLKTTAKIVLRGVYFDFDRSEIRPDSEPVLDEAAAILEANPEIDLVVIEGHTDSVGTDEYNQALSERRAESVFRYLVNAGVAPEKLRTEGYGESQPVATNETEEGRAQNRRVELRVVP